MSVNDDGVHEVIRSVSNINDSKPMPIGTYTSTVSFSLEGEGWDEGYIIACFYSPLPNPLQQEREPGQSTLIVFIIQKSCVDTYAYAT
jgi:hypothetical protein